MNDRNQLYCTFRLADQWLGVPIEDVKEVTIHAACTRIPHAPGEVAGYVNLRGHIYLALDLRRLLGMGAAGTDENGLIIFRPHVGPACGARVDAIADIIPVAASQTEEFRAGESGNIAGDRIRRVDIVTRVCRLPAGLLVILDPRRFVRVVEQAMTDLERRGEQS